MPPAGWTRDLWQRSARQQHDDGRRRNRNQPTGQKGRMRRRRKSRQERRSLRRQPRESSLTRNRHLDRSRRPSPKRRQFRQLRQPRCPNRSGIQPARLSTLPATRRRIPSRRISVRTFAPRGLGPGRIASRDAVDRITGAPQMNLAAAPRRRGRSSPQQTTSLRTRCSTSRPRRSRARETS